MNVIDAKSIDINCINLCHEINLSHRINLLLVN